MKFVEPEYLKLLFFLPALLPLWLFQFWTKRRTRGRLGTTLPLRKISHLSSLTRDGARYFFLNIVMASLIFALSQPQSVQEKVEPQPKRMDVTFLLDISPSMRAEDIHPSRLERALEVIGTFSEKKPSHDRIGLVSFSSGSLILSYLTEDPNNILFYLDYLRDDKLLNLGTNIGRALENAVSVVSKELKIKPETAHHKRVFILLSDGEDHGRELEPAVQTVKDMGIKVHTIGIGSRDGARIPIAWDNGDVEYLEDHDGNRIISRFNESTLGWIAEETGGETYRAFTGQELEEIFGEIVHKEREIEGFKKTIEYDHLYHRFLLVAFGAFVITLLL